MKKLNVLIEKNGRMILAGNLLDTGDGNARFVYDENYRKDLAAHPISLSLPFQEEAFSREKTKQFFDGLLPEGFTRRTLAQMLHKGENDYLSILMELGRECIGAIQILEEGDDRSSADYVPLDTKQIRRLAEEGVSRSAEIVMQTHLSLTGASGKAGLYYNKEKQDWYLPIGDAPSTHIVKQSHVRLDSIVANEQLSLMTAKALGLDVPDSFIINSGKYRDEDILFATKRFDREFYPHCQKVNGLAVPARLHQEDFAQALGISAADKYETGRRGYLKAMFELLRKYSADPISDQLKLWDIFIFDYLVGNTDNHIKNVSLLYSPDLSSVRLAPAYDILSTAVYESSTRDMAFYIGPDISLNRIGIDSFEAAAREAGLGMRMAMARFRNMKEHFEASLQSSAEELKQQGFEKAYDLRDRIMDLGGIANNN